MLRFSGVRRLGADPFFRHEASTMGNRSRHAGTDHTGQYSDHFQAASQYQAAAHHHLQAAHHQEHGQHEAAMKHAEAARRHGDMGHEASARAAKANLTAHADANTD